MPASLGGCLAVVPAKHDWITATLSQLGLVSHPQHRLYDDDPYLNRSHQLAS